ncbi:MAG: hypothetical protein KAI47_17020 [Deltaproteobacteria bacterium]|nr:hypothetical protein [Deltaproteobacteria bacterium]
MSFHDPAKVYKATEARTTQTLVAAARIGHRRCAMARVAIIPRAQRAVIASRAAERDLLASAEKGRIVLNAAYYAVSGETILLPEGTSELGADSVRRAFEAAAEHHETARSQRGSFHIVKQ